MKKNILLLILVSITMEVFAQDTTIVFVNNKKVAQSINKDKQDGIILLMKKSICKNYKSLAIQVKGEYVNASVYKKELEVTGDNTVIISETNGRAAYFNISTTNIKSQLKAGKKLKLYLLLNPSNPMMMIPSRRVYLGDLVMK